jgi:hypothetical protein
MDISVVILQNAHNQYFAGDNGVRKFLILGNFSLKRKPTHFNIVSHTVYFVCFFEHCFPYISYTLCSMFWIPFCTFIGYFMKVIMFTMSISGRVILRKGITLILIIKCVCCVSCSRYLPHVIKRPLSGWKSQMHESFIEPQNQYIICNE